ncbi:Translation initiation factor eIF4E [Rasamsonia emersonii CBS 393.64]|uniref:Translation initiation factor eIF4E n=1 Tax=Rasamsonia emersonii (strain ATCC 16479 / CBS 393.64 / IMI 116815) TaxID=1408163 RepID=A0A0F4YKN0_RASE3|nr:Translation initiation factor eIF4E [Rasamsonia emersonii CBS 393.64]KKA18784.1 Translation initiation factor eIF4E [Rasamsonia emersonii CBS 393.64]
MSSLTAALQETRARLDDSITRLDQNRCIMSKPTIQVNGRESLVNEEKTVNSGSGSRNSNDNGSIAAMRKSLHQNIIGKLRPLPFQYRWTVWFDKHCDSNNNNRLYVLHEDVADIATFYRVYNNYPWDKIRLRDSVHIFRKGVKPVPDDPENRNGGCWTFRVPKAKSQAFFHEIAILCMANEFQAALESGSSCRSLSTYVSIYLGQSSTNNLFSGTEHDHVLGVSTSVRFNSHLISVWNKLGSNERSIKRLEATILDRLSPELRPTTAAAGGNSSYSYFYKRHAEHDEGFQKQADRRS